MNKKLEATFEESFTVLVSLGSNFPHVTALILTRPIVSLVTGISGHEKFLPA
jgi:hypothetical protein